MGRAARCSTFTRPDTWATGQGFYDWSGRDPGEVKTQTRRSLGELLAFLERLR